MIEDAFIFTSTTWNFYPHIQVDNTLRPINEYMSVSRPHFFINPEVFFFSLLYFGIT